MTNFISFLILMLLLIGRRYRYTNKRLHIRLMSLVIASDTILVVYLAVARNALAKINGHMPPLLMVHVTFAVSTVGLYYYAIYVGRRLGAGAEEFRPRMRVIDRWVVPMRIMTFVTSVALQFYNPA